MTDGPLNTAELMKNFVCPGLFKIPASISFVNISCVILSFIPRLNLMSVLLVELCKSTYFNTLLSSLFVGMGVDGFSVDGVFFCVILSFIQRRNMRAGLWV
eukprot:601460_1